MVDVMDDAELARRSLLGFGEMAAVLGRSSLGAAAEVRRPDALGARNDAADDNPWFNAAIVPAGAVPPADDPGLPYCVWTFADAVPGRVEEPSIATPCMGVALDRPDLRLEGGAQDPEAPSLEVLGDMNERAYGQPGGFTPLIRGLRDGRVRLHGLREGGAFICVALTLRVGDDVGIHYVATDEGRRRRGLASRLLLSVLEAARAEGLRSATLQASADGLSVYERLGFRRVGTMRGYLRPDNSR